MAGPHDHFVPLYARYIRKHCQGVRYGDPTRALALAARLFAVAQQLVDDRHDLEDLEDEQEYKSVAQLFDTLKRLPDEVSAVELYSILRDALSTLEATFCTEHDDGARGRVEVGEVRQAGHVKLGGRVVFWVRPHRVYRHLRTKSFDDAEERDESLPPGWLEHPGLHLDRLFCYWQRSTRPPQIRRAWPERDIHGPLLQHSGRELERLRSLKIALCPMLGNAYPRFELQNKNRGFRASVDCPMVEPEGHSVRQQLEAALESARRDQIHLMVFPELTIDLATRDWLAKRLSKTRSTFPNGIVAGSFHVDKDTASRPYNESLLLDDKGQLLLAHCKDGWFRISDQQMRAAVRQGFFGDPETLDVDLEQLPKSITEHIQPGADLHLLETGFAQIAVLICADAIDRRNRPDMHNAILSLMPDLVLIPAMSFETDPFSDFANSLLERGIGALFVNAQCACGPDEMLALVSLDQFQEKSGPPTRLRWRSGCEPEAWDPRADKWRRYPISYTPRPTEPFSWLRGSGQQTLGLTVDLAAFWRGAHGGLSS